MNTQEILEELRYCAGLCHYCDAMPEMHDPTGTRTSEEVTRDYLLHQANVASRAGWPTACAALGRAGTADKLSDGGAIIMECARAIDDSATARTSLNPQPK